MSDNIIEFPRKKEIVEAVKETIPQVGGNEFVAVSLVMASITQDMENDPKNEYTTEDLGHMWFILYDEFLRKHQPVKK